MSNHWKNSPGNEDSHYIGEVQPIDLILSQKLGFLDGSIIKYVTRRKKKGGIEDLRKATWFLGKLIEQEGEVKDLERAIMTMKAFLENKKSKIPLEISSGTENLISAIDTLSDDDIKPDPDLHNVFEHTPKQ
ncbi:MAG: DUF3310 domain-containing protein [Halanaerobiales bacterium]|nr:DUF3310 domain-containing protein [Halanaerobiales bacterium]